MTAPSGGFRGAHFGDRNPLWKGERMTEKPNVTLPGTVEQIIESEGPSEPEKAQISIAGADDLYREIRIENELTDENGEKVALRNGADAEITVEADQAATTPKTTKTNGEK